MQSRRRSGVIGLGRQWDGRDRSLYERLAERLRVATVYDQVALRAAIEARKLGCEVSGGLQALAARQSVDIVHIPVRQWYGLQAVEAAVRHDRPVYCGLVPHDPPEAWEGVAALVRSSGIPFALELPRRQDPATRRLRELIEGPLGLVRSIHGVWRVDVPAPPSESGPLVVDLTASLIDLCRYFFSSDPTAIRSSTGSTDGFDLDFPGGGQARIEIVRVEDSSAPGFVVEAEHGSARVESIDRLRWNLGDAVFEETLQEHEPIGLRSLRGFLDGLDGLPADPGLGGIDDALAIARAVEGWRVSRAERRAIALRAY